MTTQEQHPDVNPDTRKVWFVPINPDFPHNRRGCFQKGFYFDIRYNVMHNIGGWTLFPKLKMGNYRLTAADVEEAKREALRFIKQCMKDKPEWMRKMINKYEI